MLDNSTPSPLPSDTPTQEERYFAVGACISAHFCFGAVPLIIFLFKRRESTFVAYHAALATLAGATVVASLALFLLVNVGGSVGSFLLTMLTFGADSSGTGAVGLQALLTPVLWLFSCLSWLLLAASVPGLFAVMMMSAVSAWHGRYFQMPVYSRLARKIAGLP